MSRTYYHRHQRKSYKWPPYWRNIEDRATRTLFRSRHLRQPDLDLVLRRPRSLKGYYD